MNNNELYKPLIVGDWIEYYTYDNININAKYADYKRTHQEEIVSINSMVRVKNNNMINNNINQILLYGRYVEDGLTIDTNKLTFRIINTCNSRINKTK
jgi:hypothetical protein